MKKLIVMSWVVLVSAPLFAENSQTLPAGRFRARIKPMFAMEFDTQFGNDGTVKSLASRYAKSADQNMLKKLGGPQNLGLANLMASNHVNSLGDFVPTLSASSLILGSAVEYGLTDNLTLGVIVPVISANTKFDIQFNPSSEALHSANATIIGASSVMLQKVKDLAASKGYSMEDWQGLGLGDIEVGVKYRLLNTEAWTLATKSGARLPTGRVDDPNRLTDIAFGDGQTDLGTTLLLDYKGIPNTLFNLMTKYTAQLPDRQPLRVPDDGDLFTDKIENIKRNLGDRLDAAVYGEYSFWTVFNVNATYSLFTKEKDKYKSDLGFYAVGLEKDTAQSRQAADVGVGFSTLPWFRQKSFSLPMDAGINLELPVAGKNVAKATTVNLEYKLYF